MKYRFEVYCKNYQDIENYEKALADDFKNWEVHHRLETHNSDGERRLVDITADELNALDMYYNRPASELIFLPISEHRSLHSKGEKNSFYGKHHSEEIKKKMSEARKGKHLGKDNPFYGKTHSEEFRKKIGEINKVKMKGMRFFNNGKINIRAKECPEGFVPGRIKKLWVINTQS